MGECGEQWYKLCEIPFLAKSIIFIKESNVGFMRHEILVLLLRLLRFPWIDLDSMNIHY